MSIVIGNPITYLGASLTWNGRQLTSYNGTVDSKATNVKYTYNANGLRGSKTVTEDSKTTAYNYYYVGGQLRYETRGNLKFYYFYDESGNLSAIRYYDEAGTAHAYFALTNTQGDVISLYNNNGVHVASYEYDAWGNCTITKDTDGVAELNPIRYRGYYYDTETKLYYLKSRYYNPQVGRFLNSDNITDSNAGVLGYNTFIYCANNPIDSADPSGHGKIWEWIKKTLGFESTTSTSQKKEEYSWGSKWLFQYSSGKTSKVTTTETSNTSVTVFSNTDTSTNDATFNLGIKNQNSSFSFNSGTSGFGASLSCNSDICSGEIEFTSSTAFSTLTITEYLETTDNSITGHYDSYQINNVTTAAIVVTAILLPEIAVTVGGALGSGMLPCPA